MWTWKKIQCVLDCTGDWCPVEKLVTWGDKSYDRTGSKILWKLRKSGEFWHTQKRGSRRLYKGRCIRMGPLGVRRTFVAHPQTWGGGHSGPKDQFWAKGWDCDSSRWTFFPFKGAPPLALHMWVNGSTIHLITRYLSGKSQENSIQTGLNVSRFLDSITGEPRTSWSVDPNVSLGIYLCFALPMFSSSLWLLSLESPNVCQLSWAYKLPWSCSVGKSIQS